MSKQYLESTEIQELVGKLNLTTLKLISSDSYNETAILNAVKNTGMISELACASLQTSIIGFGNKSYGSFNFKGSDIDVKTLFNQCLVKWNIDKNSKLCESDLTPRRLQRLFRYHIKTFLMTNSDISPYLWRKYSTKDEAFRSVTYPGSEHAITMQAEADYLIETYNNLDLLHDTNISLRIKRVLLARGFNQTI